MNSLFSLLKIFAVILILIVENIKENLLAKVIVCCNIACGILKISYYTI